MGYRVTPEGEILCDTVDDAIALAKKIRGGKGWESQKPTLETETGSRWNESRYREFMGLVKGNQKHLVELLLKNPHGKTDRSIRQELRLGTNYELAGVTAGLAKNAKKAGLMSTSELFTKEVMQQGDERVLEYKLSEGFRAIAEKVKLKEKLKEIKRRP